MSLILSEYIEPFSACLIKSVCKIFDVKVTNTHCCSLAKNDPLVSKLTELVSELVCYLCSIRTSCLKEHVWLFGLIMYTHDQ